MDNDQVKQANEWPGIDFWIAISRSKGTDKEKSYHTDMHDGPKDLIYDTAFASFLIIVLTLAGVNHQAESEEVRVV